MNKVCLVGNPNCGKSTLFNILTGAHQRVGNFTGVTVESKSGLYKKNKQIEVVDLPGLYSLNSKSKDEAVVLEYIKREKPDYLINVVDGTNLSRNLYLTLELLKLKIPMVIAVNFSDQLDKNGIVLETEKLAQFLGTDVLKISALKNQNIDKLMKTVLKSRLSDVVFSGEFYTAIDKIVDNVLKKRPIKAEKISNKIDDVLLNKYLGIPIMFVTVFLIYFISFRLGSKISSSMEKYFSSFIDNFNLFLFDAGAKEWLLTLVCDTVLKGVCGVICFLPQILFIIVFMALLEESGYTSRMAFNLDRLFREIGLSGKSIIPLTLSCGCIATGLNATRNIEDEGERKMTVILAPFMPCSAKVAVFGWFSSILFNGNALVATSMYFISIICVAVFGKILKRKKSLKSDGTFILEMPVLRIPSLKSIFIVAIEKSKDFLIKVGCTVLLISVALWLFESFGITGYVGNDIEKSFLYSIGNAIKYIFYPLGFGSWQTSIAVLSGIFAKEGVIETLQIVTSDFTALFDNGFSMYAFEVFILLSPPCLSSLITAKSELKDSKIFWQMIIFEFLVAYCISFIINGIGTIIYNKELILGVLIAIICLVIVIIPCVLKNKCKGCKFCKGSGLLCRKKKHNTI